MRGRLLWFSCGVALMGIVASVLPAAAGHSTAVPQWTGCIGTGGALVSLARGTSPAKPCASTTKVVHLSGGDITAISTAAAGGLQGGVGNGAAALSLRPSFQLPQAGCQAGDIVTRTDNGWACEAPPQTPALPSLTWWGDSSDGDVTIPADAPTLLARDMHYRNLTLAPGAILRPNGFRIFVSETLTMGAGSLIARNGENGPGPGTAGAPNKLGLPSGTLGGSGGTTAPFAPKIDNALGGDGGVGANGPPAEGQARDPSAAAGGSAFSEPAAAAGARTLENVRIMGGGGGDGDSNTASGGGTGAGVIVVVARQIAGAGTLAAVGGNGAAGHATGGGGGGVVFVVTTVPQPLGITMDVSGGAPGKAESCVCTAGQAGQVRWLIAPP